MVSPQTRNVVDAASYLSQKLPIKTSDGGNITGLTYNSPTYVPGKEWQGSYGTVPMNTQPAPIAPQTQTTVSPVTPTAPQNAPTPSIMSDEEVVNLFNKMRGTLAPQGNSVYSQQLGGSALDQLKRLQAQRADEKANRKGLYEVDPNMAFSPDQIRQQLNAADQFYNEQLGGLAVAAENELKSTTSNKGVGSLSSLSELPTALQNYVVKDLTDIESTPWMKEYIQTANSANTFDEALKRIKQTGKATANDDQNLVVLFAKALDPDSVVRESEFDVTMKFGTGVLPPALSSVSRLFNKNANGEYVLNTKGTVSAFLTDATREAMRQSILDRMAGRKTVANNLVKQRQQRAETLAGGTDLSDLYQGVDYLYNVESNRTMGAPSTDTKIKVNPSDPVSWEMLGQIQL